MDTRVNIMALFVRLVFFAAAADILYAIQYMDDLNKLALLTDSECEVLCKLVRCPEDNVVIPRDGTEGELVTIPVVGANISVWSVQNLKLAGFYIPHQI